LSFATDDEDANLLLRSGKSTLSARRRTTEEVLSERTRHYHEKGKEIDFFVVLQPAFLESPEQSKAQCPQPSAAVISTNWNLLLG